MGRITIGLAILIGTLASAAGMSASAPRGGTIAISAQPQTDPGDRLTASVAQMVSTTLGTKGFTLLGDPDHAAYLAEVSVERTDIGTSVATAATGRALATGGGVSIPLSRGSTVLAPLQRITVQVSIRRRGDQTVLWHGAAMTVRPGRIQGGGADDLSSSLSQAALSSYPVQAPGTISIP